MTNELKKVFQGFPRFETMALAEAYATYRGSLGGLHEHIAITTKVVKEGGRWRVDLYREKGGRHAN